MPGNKLDKRWRCIGLGEAWRSADSTERVLCFPVAQDTYLLSGRVWISSGENWKPVDSVGKGVFSPPTQEAFLPLEEFGSAQVRTGGWQTADECPLFLNHPGGISLLQRSLDWPRWGLEVSMEKGVSFSTGPGDISLPQKSLDQPKLGQKSSGQCIMGSFLFLHPPMKHFSTQEESRLAHVRLGSQ